MENYQSAFIERSQDQSILHEQQRQIASMHMGGIAIECFVKSIVLANRPSGSHAEWKTDSNNPGHTMTNPQHNLQKACKRNPRLYGRIQRFPEVLQWINKIQNPCNHFIDLRYCSELIKDEEYKQWHHAYESLKGWLEKQSSKL